MQDKNRLLKYLIDSAPQAKCVIISDAEKYSVALSFDGERFVWRWEKGLICPGNPVPYQIHPMAAQALVAEEVATILRLEGLVENTIYVNSSGEKVNGVVLNPPELGEMSYDLTLKKQKLQELYEKFVFDGDRISEEMIGEAISHGVLSPFLSLVNL
jgi:hypothetical protein